MQGIILIVLVMVFSAIVLTIQGVGFYLQGKRDEEVRRLRERLGLSEDDEEEAIANLLREQAADTALDRLGTIGDKLNLMIQQSGKDLTVSALVAQMGLAFLMALVVLTVVVGPQAAPLALAAGYGPYWWVSSTAAKRAKRLLEQMPDALEMMGRAMQAGAGLSDGFALVQDEMDDPIASEFGRIYDEVRFGKDYRTALSELIDRNPTLFELRLFVSSILLQRDTGGNMIETVNRISKLIRQRYVFDAKVRAMTSEARASGFVLAVMPIGVLVLVLMANAPYLYPLIDTAVGQMLIVYAIASYGMGMFLMSSSSKVEV